MSVPNALVLDAGPLIALLYQQDPDHSKALRGFESLANNNTRLIAPAPIVLEVSKWLLFEAGKKAMREGLIHLVEALEILPVGPEDLLEVQAILSHLPRWGGTVEDALVARLALTLGVPIWTLNFRDLTAFKALEFWNA